MRGRVELMELDVKLSFSNACLEIIIQSLKLPIFPREVCLMAADFVMSDVTHSGSVYSLQFHQINWNYPDLTL